MILVKYLFLLFQTGKRPDHFGPFVIESSGNKKNRPVPLFSLAGSTGITYNESET